MRKNGLLRRSFGQRGRYLMEKLDLVRNDKDISKYDKRNTSQKQRETKNGVTFAI